MLDQLCAVKNADAEVVGTGFLEKLLEECQEIPLFLRDSLGYFSGSAHVSLDDFFWVGGDDDPLHPYLAKGLLVMVNRRRKTPFHFGSKPWWQQPLYIILMRDGTYLACCCAVENGCARDSSLHAGISIAPHSTDFTRMPKSSDKLLRSCGDFREFGWATIYGRFSGHIALFAGLSCPSFLSGNLPELTEIRTKHSFSGQIRSASLGST